MNQSTTWTGGPRPARPRTAPVRAMRNTGREHLPRAGDLGRSLILSALMILIPIAPAASVVQETILPSETCRGIFFVPVTVGGEDGPTLDMFFDTGASWTFIDRAALRDRFDLDIPYGKVRFDEARIGPHHLGRLTARVASLDTLGLALGRRIDGILAFEEFRDVLLTLDYPSGQVRVSGGRLPRPDGREVFRTARRDRPHVKVEVGGRRRWVLIDSGSTGRFSLKEADRVSWAVDPRVTGAGAAFGGIFIRQAGRMDGILRFGSLTFVDPVVSFARSDSRLAGWHVLRHFVLTFDQRKRRVRMRPASEAPVRLAPIVAPGLALVPRPEGYEVIRVLQGTSAERAGLRRGDLIVALDGIPAHEVGCRDPEGDAPGTVRVMTFLRDGRRHEVEVSVDILVP